MTDSPAAARIFFRWFLAVVAMVLAVATAIDRDFLYACFLSGSYFLLVLLALVWLAEAFGNISKNGSQIYGFLQKNGLVLCFSFLFAAFLFMSVGPYFRVLSDETNLLAVSKSMYFDHKAQNINQGKWSFFNYEYLEAVDPRRPFLFPFLTHLLHYLFGYRTYHPFIINYLALAGTFFLIFLLVKKYLGGVAAWSSFFLIAAHPVVTQTAASAGIDWIMVFFITLCFFSLDRYLMAPGENSFALLWLHLLFLANTRYEAPLYALVIFGCLLAFKKVPFHYFKTSFIYPLTPLLVLPILWQRVFIRFEWQAPLGVPVFSFEHLLKHQGDFFRSLLRWDFFLPYANVIIFMGLISLIYVVFFEVRPRVFRNESLKIVLITAFFVFISSWLLNHAYYHDAWVTPDGSRLFALSGLAFSLLALIGLYRIPFVKEKPSLILLLSIFLFGIYHSVAIEGRFSNGLVQGREYRIVLDFLKDKDVSHTLIVDDRPGMYTVRNFGAVSFTYANRHKEELLKELESHQIGDIFVIEEIDYETQRSVNLPPLDSAYLLEPLLEFQNKTETFVRVSRVSGKGVL